MTRANKTDVVFDGHHLADLFEVESVTKPVAGTPDPETSRIVGADGSRVTGMRYGTITISVTLACISESEDARAYAMRTLAGGLAVDGPKWLKIPGYGGMHFLAVPDGEIAETLISDKASHVSLRFLVAQPWAFSDAEHSASSTGGAASLVVEGTAPTPVRIESAAASGNFQVRTDDGTQCTVAVGSTAKALVIDSETRSVTVGTGTGMLTLSSDWIMLDPGSHSLTRMTGAGEFTAYWYERWR